MSLVAQNLPFDQCISFDRDDSIANDDISDDALCNLTVFRLRFASWVAGRKLGGPGAQGALPSAKDVDECLGVTYASVTGRLTMRPKERMLVLVELSLLLGTGVLVLLILRHQIIEIGLGLGELHLVHALAGVPVEECLATEHDRELLGDALPGILDGGGVANEGGDHLEALGGDIADGGLDVVGDPLASGTNISLLVPR